MPINFCNELFEKLFYIWNRISCPSEYLWKEYVSVVAVADLKWAYSGVSCTQSSTWAGISGCNIWHLLLSWWSLRLLKGTQSKMKPVVTDCKCKGKACKAHAEERRSHRGASLKMHSSPSCPCSGASLRDRHHKHVRTLPCSTSRQRYVPAHMNTSCEAVKRSLPYVFTAYAKTKLSLLATTKILPS